VSVAEHSSATEEKEIGVVRSISLH
jgi:hypothetical protein